jgi:hypothetical protein
MKLERNLIPIIAIGAIILLVVPAVGMVVGMALASDPGDGSLASTGEPELVPFELPPLPEKEFELTESPPGVSSISSRSDSGDSTSQGEIYTYEDGDRIMRVVLQGDLVLKSNSTVSSDDRVLMLGPSQSIVKSAGGGGVGGLPVFRSESGGGLMTLPGGVLLALDPEWDKVQVDSFFSDNGISPGQVSELGFMQNGFLVETDAGFPSLELANSLAGQDGVEASTPNWWNEVKSR